MTDWEVHDVAVQVVRDHIVSDLGFELMSSQGKPSVDPSLWFVGETTRVGCRSANQVSGANCAAAFQHIGDSRELRAFKYERQFCFVAVAGEEDAFERTDDAPDPALAWSRYRLSF